MRVVAHGCFVVATLVLGIVMPGSVLADSEDAAPVWQMVESSWRLSTTPAARFDHHGENVNLQEGTLLLEADKPSVISTPLSSLQVKPHSVVYAKVNGGCEHLFVLLGPTRVTVGKHSVQLNSGDEAVVSDHETTNFDLAGQDDIGRRGIKVTKLADKLSFALSEFSLIQAVEREPMLYRLLHSLDPHDKSLRERLIKTAAVLNIVTGRHGRYSTGVR